MYTENPKEVTKNLWELINEFSKVAGHKGNIKINSIFIHYQWTIWNEIKKTTAFIIPSKIVRYIGINLTKEMKFILWKFYNILKRN